MIPDRAATWTQKGGFIPIVALKVGTPNFCSRATLWTSQRKSYCIFDNSYRSRSNVRDSLRDSKTELFISFSFTNFTKKNFCKKGSLKRYCMYVSIQWIFLALTFPFFAFYWSLWSLWKWNWKGKQRCSVWNWPKNVSFEFSRLKWPKYL